MEPQDTISSKENFHIFGIPDPNVQATVIAVIYVILATFVTPFIPHEILLANV